MSIWHVLVLLAIVAFYAIPIVIAVRRVRRERRQGAGLTPGLKGWLFILIWGLCLGSLGYLGSMARYYASTDIAVAWAEYPALILGEALLNLLHGLSLCVLVGCGLGKSRYFRSASVWLLIVTVLAYPLDLLAVTWALDAQGTAFEVFDQEGIREAARQVAAVLGVTIWTIYARRSRRVALTYVR